MLLLARELLLHDPLRVLAWRLQHEPRLQAPPAWLQPLLPRAPADLDRDPIALLLAGLAAGFALAYLAAALAGASRGLRMRLVATACTVLVALPSLAFVAMGAATGRPYGQDGGVVQLPLAIGKILQGESPYGADYSDSILGKEARASAFWGGRAGNPILRHHAYLPGTHLLMLPFYLAGRAVGIFDPRVVTLLFYAAAIFLAAQLPSTPPGQLSAAALVGLNPLLYWQQIFGANDIVFVALLLLVALLGRAGRPGVAGALLGLACATKQLAWPFAPFLLLSLSGARSLRELGAPTTWIRAARPVLAALVLFLAVVAPVAALDLRAFWRDIVQYNVGLSGVDNYPLGGTPGLGVANFLIYFGRVRSLQDAFPFALSYVLLVPLGVALLARQARAGRIEAAFVLGSVALLASLYFSRVFHPNYLIPAASLLPLGVLSLGLAADIALVPLALLSLGVEMAANEVFRATWDQAMAAQLPAVLSGLLASLCPRAGAELTADPLGLLLSATATGLGLLYLALAALGASERTRALLGVVAVLGLVAAPTAAVAGIGMRTGAVRAEEPWAVQVQADALRLGAARSPYAPPPPERPRGREAWSMSLRLDPPRELRPGQPLLPPGATWIGVVGQLVGLPDPRLVSLLALLALGLTVRALTPPGDRGLAAGLLLLAPLALGSTFGAASLLPLAALGLTALAAARGRPTLAGALLGMAMALDPAALAALPLLSLAPGALASWRSMGMAAASWAAIVGPVALLDLRSFAEAVARLAPGEPGVGFVNLMLYGGATATAALGWLLRAGLIGVAAYAAVAALRVSGVRGFGLAALGSLAWLWLSPTAPADAVALPLGLLFLGAVVRNPGGPQVANGG